MPEPIRESKIAAGSRLGERRFGRSLAEYSRWGFIGLERPQIDVYRKTSVGRFDRASRVDLLRAMARRRGEIALTDLAEIDHAVSRPQAVSDARAAGLLLRGVERGGRWVWPTPGQRVLIGAWGEVAEITSEPDGRGFIEVRAGRRTRKVRASQLTLMDLRDVAGRASPSSRTR